MKHIRGTSYKILIQLILVFVLIVRHIVHFATWDHIVPTSSFNIEYSRAKMGHKFGLEATS